MEDNRKLISAATPLEVYAAIRRRERSGAHRAGSRAARLEILRLESARMVQQPLNPAVLEAARQLLDRTTLRWPEALQLGSALAARDMFPGTEIIFVSASAHLLEAAKMQGLATIDPVNLPANLRVAEPVGEPTPEIELAKERSSSCAVTATPAGLQQS